jgi:hypothetical protein
MLQQVARAWDLEPGRILTTEAKASHHRTYSSPSQGNEQNALLITAVLNDAVKKKMVRGIISPLANGSPGEIRTPVDGFLPDSNGPKPVTGRACVPLLVRYTTGLRSALDMD